MGFYGYGNRSDVSKNTSFVFDMIYPNRKAMEEGMANDGVYLGRHVLIEYDIEASSLDFKKAFLNSDALKVQGLDILYFSADLDSEKRILYDAVNNTIENNIIYTTTKNTMVYIVQDNQNVYYKCVGYVSLDKNTENGVIIEINGTEQKLISADLANTFVEDIQYALFQKVEGLVTDDSANNYAKNYNIDVAWAKSKNVTISGHGWDSTVWEKTIVQDVEKYVMIAELNTVVPTFAISADAPSQTPLTPHFDTASTDVYYNLHWQPQWGMRVQLANGAESEASAITEPNTGKILSDDTTSWVKTTYNKSTGKTEMYYYTKNGTWQRISSLAGIGADGKLPAAVYFNKAGFSATNRYHSSLKDSIEMKPTGISGQEYNTHVSGKTETAPDIQEMSMVLPSIGNAISDMWDIVYGDGDKQDNTTSARMTDIAWLSSPIYNDRRRLQLVKTKDGKNYDYDVEAVQTLAGSINSVHDLMGMIIIEEDGLIENLDNYAITKAQRDSIYYLNNKFYRKAPVKQYIELTEGEYNYILASGLDEDRYNTYSYYIKNEDDSYSQATEAFNPDTEYYQKEVEGKMTKVDLTTFKEIMETNKTYYLYRNGNYDYIYDTKYAADRQYFLIDTSKITEVGVMDNSYEPNKFYYKVVANDKLNYIDYYLDTSPVNPLYTEEYQLASSPVTARKIYVPGDWYSVTADERNNNVYSLDLQGYNSKKKYYYITKLTNMQEAAEADILVYQQKAKVQIERTLFGSDRKIFYYILKDEPNQQIEVWLDSSKNKYFPTSLPTVDDSAAVDLTKGSVRPAYKYVVDKPVKYVQYKGEKTDIIQDGTTKAPIFYTLNPYDAEYESANELYAAHEVSGLYSEITSINYFKLDENGNYIRVQRNTEVPDYFSEDETKFYTLEITPASDKPFYQNSTYYYKGDDGLSWYFDNNGTFDENRKYCILPEEAITEVALDLSDYDIYEAGKYYYAVYNRYMVDNAIEPTVGRDYFKGQDDYVVYSDSKGVLVLGSHWNTMLPVPHFVTLGRKGEDSYRMEELVGFARSLNTIHGLILQINSFLEYGNETTRDTSTVQGTLNKLNDIIAKFDLIDWGQVAVTDAYGRLHTAPFETDEWVKAYVDPDVENPIIHIQHTYNPVEDTTETVDMNTNAADRLILTELQPDEMGHIVNRNTKTVTLPSGIKKVVADSGEYVAGTTQAAFEIKTADDWLSTVITGNRLAIAHEDPQAAINTKGLLNNQNPKFGESFVVPNIAIDDKGHVQELDEATLTLPLGSLTKGEGNVVIDMAFTPETGAIVETKALVGNVKLGVYDNSVAGTITSEDSIAQAIAKTNSLLQTTKTELENNITNSISTVNEAIQSLINTHNQDKQELVNSINTTSESLKSLIEDNEASINNLSNTHAQDKASLENLCATISDTHSQDKAATDEALNSINQNITTVTEDLKTLQDTHNSDISFVTEKMNLLVSNFNTLLERISDLAEVADLKIE